MDLDASSASSLVLRGVAPEPDHDALRRAVVERVPLELGLR